MIQRYTSIGNGIYRMERAPWLGYGLLLAKRPPKPVKELFAQLKGPREVLFDTKTRVATVVPWWEQVHQ